MAHAESRLKQEKKRPGIATKKYDIRALLRRHKFLTKKNRKTP